MTDSAIRKSLGANIKRFRELLGYKQIELSRAIGKKSPAYIALIESGDRNISAVDLINMAAVLGVEIQELIQQ